MLREKLTSLIIFVAMVGHFGKSDAKELEANFAGARLPTALVRGAAVYDGIDNVYIFGGYVTYFVPKITINGKLSIQLTGFLINRYAVNKSTADILRYTISLDKIQKVSSLSTGTDGGLALLSSDGMSIYYIGGYYSTTLVHKFNIVTNTTMRLPVELPSSVNRAGGVSINGSLFIFNGQKRNFLEFNEDSETAKIIGDLPFENGTSTVHSTVAIPTGQSGAWLFAGNYNKPINPILQFNSTNKSVQTPSMDTASLPTLFAFPAPVWDGRHGYLIGALGYVYESDGSRQPTNGILR
jgi:hypothetical protein